MQPELIPAIREENMIYDAVRGSQWRVKCTHLDQIRLTHTDKDVCEDCIKTGDTWVHPRMCLECGHVGCYVDEIAPGELHGDRFAIHAWARRTSVRTAQRGGNVGNAKGHIDTAEFGARNRARN